MEVEDDVTLRKELLSGGRLSGIDRSIFLLW